MKELAVQFQVHRTTISKHLTKLGVETREVRIGPEQIDEARRLYESGLSLAAVGGQLGFEARTIHLHLLELGVMMRDTHGRPR